MKCQLKYKWVKLPRNQMPPGKGIMGAWTRLASRAAFRNGKAVYCNYINEVTLGSWAGGMVGFKSILGVKRRKLALDAAEKLVGLDYIRSTEKVELQTKSIRNKKERKKIYKKQSQSAKNNV